MFEDKDFNIIKYNLSRNFNNFITKLLQELYIILLNIDIKHDIEVQLNEFMNNFLFEYELDTKVIFDIMTSNSQNISYYSSLIGFFYQYGIGCEIDKIKASEIFFDTVKNSLNQLSFEKINDEITFYDDDNNERKAFIWYLILANKNSLRAIYIIAKCYRDGIGGIDKNLEKAIKWFNQFLSFYKNSPITLNDFLNGSNINTFKLSNLKDLKF
ncbi:20496_t:CDS:2 [Rhizophagus irregularis]|nr:20496_t:CDS:2 [Rhizophagus irregularis]